VTNSTEHLNVEPERGSEPEPRVIHIVVGHGLRTYFLNTVRSVRKTSPGDEILVIDNASPDWQLRRDMLRLAEDDPKMRLILRDSNSLINGKVGGLYDAYRDAFELALEERFDYAHIVQGDMQVLWWDSEVISRAATIFESDKRCVNIYTCLLSSDWSFSEALEEYDPGSFRFRDFGLTDLGVYDLKRWRELGVSWANDEIEHGKKYRSEGFSVICHPWPTDAQIPWPAVVRNGVQQGREVTQVRSFLLKPMTTAEVAQTKARNRTWLEDVCIPWGWTCMTPMWTTHLNADYLANRRADFARRGFSQGRPRWERRGLDNSSWLSVLTNQHRPSLWKLLVVVPAHEFVARLKRRLHFT
jgi:hypothetical protein